MKAEIQGGGHVLFSEPRSDSSRGGSEHRDYEGRGEVIG